MSVLITVGAPKRWLFLIKSICLFNFYPHVVFFLWASAYRNIAAVTCRLLKSGWLVAGVGARPCGFWTGPDAAHTVGPFTLSVPILSAEGRRLPRRRFTSQVGFCLDIRALIYRVHFTRHVPCSVIKVVRLASHQL